MKFRKKPVVIEARQLIPENSQELAEWCGGSVKGTMLDMTERVVSIETLEGEMRANMGDWIIKGVNGEFYPCKPDIFEKTYERVD
jgi:hypothetical protein